ncbi:Chloride channel protein [Durusdinium trenchii]|uniref:Chloride channel protein n=1 Tax=Durusdinium trenchii TaxID=1381693 RepID=A0ABP0N1E5_9DINO
MINFRAFPSSQALPADVDETLTEAYYSGQPVALYTVRGARPSEDVSYDVDFRQLMRTTRSTGQQHRLRYVPHPSANASKLASTASASAGRTQYQWELKNGAWADFEEEELQHLIRAWMMGHDEVLYEARGLQYEINFRRMIQINLSSGNKRHIRVKPRQADPNQPVASTQASATDPSTTAAPTPTDARSSGEPRARSQPRSGVTPPGRPKRFSLGKDGKEAKGAGQGQESEGQGGGRQTCHPSVDTDEPALPFGVQWPSAQAKAAAKALYMELLSSQQCTQAERRSCYKHKCLLWHPGKNLDKEDVATEVFQFLQLLRDWYLS